MKDFIFSKVVAVQPATLLKMNFFTAIFQEFWQHYRNTSLDFKREGAIPKLLYFINHAWFSSLPNKKISLGVVEPV